MKTKTILIASLSFGLLLAACTDNDVMTGNGHDGTGDVPVGEPVLFTVGNVGQTSTLTRAATPYMAQGGRFVCTMYYHAATGATDESDFDISDGGTMKTAWLKVNNSLGNSVYRKMDFGETGIKLDELDFDKDANIFYWQNRLTHAFLALADYNKLKDNVGAETSTDSKGWLKMYPYGDVIDTTVVDSVNVYDLTRGDSVFDANHNHIGFTIDTIGKQPDPILALTIMKPAGATQEANRVRLYFKHQFSQIQVNLKGPSDGSATITAAQIKKVELLGVSTEGYVVNRLNANGTVGPLPADTAVGTMKAASAKEVKREFYTDSHLNENPWGSSFEMFDMKKGVDADNDGNDDGYAIGFVKSFNAIAFGTLGAIRVTWREESGIFEHVTTFKVPDKNDSGEELPLLKSGMKYIYDLELRRGTLAVIRTQIIDWKQDENLVYGVDGTITN